MGKNRNKQKNAPATQHNDMAQVRGVVVRQAAIMQEHRGPIPSASELKKYEEILPGAADRILTMAEKQAAHRQKLEASVVASNNANSKRGQIFGFILSAVALIAGFILISSDKGGWGLSIIIADLAALAAAFTGNRISEFHELSRKRRDDGHDDTIKKQ